MKLQAQYDIKDLLKLVEQDLQNKGLHLVGEPDMNGHRDFILSLMVEQYLLPELVAPEAPASLPAPAAVEEKVINDETPPTPPPATEQKETIESRREKTREYNRRWLEKKRAEKSDQAHAREVLAQSRQSTHKNTETQEEREQRRTAVVAQKIVNQEVVASSSAPFPG